jgi:Complex 1 protein (LYR family)
MNNVIEIEQLSKQVLSTYRRLLHLAKKLPKSDQVSAISTIRSTFRSNKGEQSKENVQTLLREAQSKISYLKIVTPKDPTLYDSSPNASSDSTLDSSMGSKSDKNHVKTGVTRFIMQDGKLVEIDESNQPISADGARYRTNSLDSNDVRRHVDQISRAKKLGMY